MDLKIAFNNYLVPKCKEFKGERKEKKQWNKKAIFSKNNVISVHTGAVAKLKGNEGTVIFLRIHEK